MALGRRETERQGEFWIATAELAGAPRHVFYERLNQLFAEADFDSWLEELCGAYYSDEGRPSIPPGVYFRMLFIGYFEGIDSQRRIAWHCADSLSAKRFLGYALYEATPDHSSLTRIRERLPHEVYQKVFRFVLGMVDEHRLLSGAVVGVDATTLEANAAMKTIVGKDTGADWESYVRGLAAEEGMELPTKADLIRYDQQRKRRGKKKVSNQEWESPIDPDARITKMKDGTTHLAYKAEHVVDLKTEVILGAEIYPADQADSATLAESLTKAQEHVDKAGICTPIEKAAADKGYHKAATLAECERLHGTGVKTYIAEPERRGQRRWTNKPVEHQEAVYRNRSRIRRAYGKQLQRRRSEVVERSFAQVCEAGGSRRSWLRGIERVRKRYAMAVAAYNLGRIMRKLVGQGKPREFADCPALIWMLWALAMLVWKPLSRRWETWRRTFVTPPEPLIPGAMVA
jgi:transposase